MMPSHSRELHPAISRGVDTVPRASAFLLPVVLLLMATPARADIELEPNNTLVTSTPVGPLAFGEVVTIEGLIGDGPFPELDVDLFALSITDSTPKLARLTADLVPHDPSVELYIRVFNAEGAELLNNHDDRSRLALTVVEGDVVYIGISGPGNPLYDNTVGGSGRATVGGSYDLSLAVEAEAPPDSQFEPNDSADSASFMGHGSFTVSDEFIGDGFYGWLDVDVYELSLFGASRVDVEVRAHRIGSVPQPIVRLRTCRDAVPDPHFEDECRIGVADAGVNSSRDVSLSALLQRSSDLYIIVSGGGNRRYDPARSGSGEPGPAGYYDLQVTVTPLDTMGPFEPNDSIQFAEPLPGVFVTGRPETITVDGFIGDGLYAGSRGDRDYFEVRVADEAKILQVEVAAQAIGSGLDPVVTAYDGAGSILARNGNLRDFVDASLLLPAACGLIDPEFNARSLFIMVSAAQQRPSLNPFVPVLVDSSYPQAVDQKFERVTGSTGAYRLDVTAITPPVDCGLEPNDTIDTATPTGIVGSGFYACNRCEMGDQPDCPVGVDLDLWSVDVTEVPAMLRVNLSGCRFDALGSFSVQVFDAAANEVAIQSGRVADTMTDAVSALEVLLTIPGRYFVAASGRSSSPGYDPNELCSGYAGGVGSYDIGIILQPGLPDAPFAAPASAPIGTGESPSSLYATRIDDTANLIDLIDLETGEVLSSIAAPEPRFNGSEGIALNGYQLLYLGIGRYPLLYRLDVGTGDGSAVLNLWMGSGQYTDSVMLGGLLYVLDLRQQSIHVFDPEVEQMVRTMAVGSRHSIKIAGGLAALAGPNRLYIADPFATGQIYEIEPNSGALTGVLPAPDRRPMALGGLGSQTLYVADWEDADVDVIDRSGVSLRTVTFASSVGSFASEASIDPFGDFDLDGDVDLRDIAEWLRCLGVVSASCQPGDATGDGQIDLQDAAVLPAAISGP